MTTSEFISLMKQNGATAAGPADDRAITLASTALQHMRAAMLPAFMVDLYRAANGLNMNDAYIFGVTESEPMPKTIIPSIVDINRGLSHMEQLRGRTVFGRNDLFWFAFDAFGRCVMFDTATLVIARTYEDPVRAMTDCLIIGKM